MPKLEVIATPMYFATMGAEYLHHRSRAAKDGPRPSDYEPRDTLTSLTLGTVSLLVPLFAPKLLAPITPGKGKYGKHVVIGAGVAAAVTTIADRVARRLDAGDDGPSLRTVNVDGSLAEPQTTRTAPSNAERPAGRSSRRRWATVARKVASVGGVATVAAATVAATTAWGHLTRPSAMWARRKLPDLGSGAVGWTVSMVGWDFLYYLNHRSWHESRFLWANHVMHHSSERYNLSTALRQSVTDPFLMHVPYTTLSLLGVRPHMVATSRSLNLLYQYWVHTDAIDKLGPIEEFANTPSHHRAHHGVNPQYIDRNHGGILIIWDRLLGTFQRENDTVVYGLTKNIDTFNPLKAATHEYRDIFRDVAASDNWRDRLSFVLRGPGWAYERHREGRGAAAALSPAA